MLAQDFAIEALEAFKGTSQNNWLYDFAKFAGGAAVLILLQNLKKIWESASLRKAIRKANCKNLDRKKISVISGSRFEMESSQINFKFGSYKHRIAIPEHRQIEIARLVPDFVFNTSENSLSFEEKLQNTREIIPDIDVIIKQAQDDTINDFLRRIKRAERLFNGNLFHVSEIHTDVDRSPNESPRAEIELYTTDYFTSQVMHRAFYLIKNRENIVKIIEECPADERLNLFWNGFGINTVVCCMDNKDRDSSRSIVLCRRSNMVSRNAASGTWHSTVNEALSQTDMEDQRINLDRALRRGLHEEAGITENNITRNYYFNVFLGVEDMQPGICGLTICRIARADVLSSRIGSQDGSIEISSHMFLPFLSKDIKNVLKYGGIKDRHNKIVPFSPAIENILHNIVARGTENL